MEEKILTPSEAWEDFYTWIQLPENWETRSVYERHYLRKTQRQIRSGDAGARRIFSILEFHAPGRYKLNEATFTKVDAK